MSTAGVVTDQCPQVRKQWLLCAVVKLQFATLLVNYVDYLRWLVRGKINENVAAKVGLLLLEEVVVLVVVLMSLL